MYTSADQNTGQSDAIKNMKLVTYWRRVLKSQSSSILKSGKTCYHLHRKCVFSVCGVMTGALFLHQSSQCTQ